MLAKSQTTLNQSQNKICSPSHWHYQNQDQLSVLASYGDNEIRLQKILEKYLAPPFWFFLKDSLKKKKEKRKNQIKNKEQHKSP